VKLAEDGEILVSGENVSPGIGMTTGIDTGREMVSHWRCRRNRCGRQSLFQRPAERGNRYLSRHEHLPGGHELVLNRQPEVKTSAVVEIDGPHGPEPFAALILRDDMASAGEAVDRCQ